ncbi:ATP phosphoribosyltransferase [Frankliniella fusca]|uniref:ATP phosphoribosyltransferase n=1 Tax=Frankliniella fusca TaxID=407009 RepID=A0AAE1LAA1_9NEOP|nr:ATP phosphoribosyltransferase [Frankliniella fusca]
MDPLDIPHELESLTYIEKQLLSRVHPVISLLRVKKLQYKYKGQVINFTQDVQEVADSLPYLVKDLSNIVVIKLNNHVRLKDFVIRKDKVLNALLWLKRNNPQYFDLKIDMSALNTLPDDDNVYDELQSIRSEQLSSNLRDKMEEDDDLIGDQNNDDCDEITYSSVPDRGKTPLNEFKSPGYISMAFPHLFCYGTADFSMPKTQKISLNEYIRHLMLYKDGRFAKDERFRYFIMNSEMRWHSLNLGNVYVKKNSIFSKMTIIQLRQYLKENPWLVNQIMHFGSRLRTTSSYWKSRCGELLDMVDQLGTPTIFFTLSSADYHWPDFYRLMGHDVATLSVQERGRLLSENPLIADTFFHLRSKFFLENCFTKHFKVKDMWYRYEFQHRGSIHLHGVAWFENSPVIKENMTESETAAVIKYFDSIISCKNPDVHILPSPIHPCQMS